MTRFSLVLGVPAESGTCVQRAVSESPANQSASPVEVQVDRVRREAPVGPGGHAVAERLHEADLLPLEPELDARAGERVGPWALPLHPGLADEHGKSGGLIELHRVAARREIAS